jgi:hypothetical protein
MAKCDYRSSTVIFGGKRDANGRFCNQKCRGRGALLAISSQLPDASFKTKSGRSIRDCAPSAAGQGLWMYTSVTECGQRSF